MAKHPRLSKNLKRGGAIFLVSASGAGTFVVAQEIVKAIKDLHEEDDTPDDLTWEGKERDHEATVDVLLRRYSEQAGKNKMAQDILVAALDKSKLPPVWIAYAEAIKRERLAAQQIQSNSESADSGVNLDDPVGTEEGTLDTGFSALPAVNPSKEGEFLM